MKYWHRCEYVYCNKPKCRSCPHGPYWYGFYRAAGRLKKRYFGLLDPRPLGSEEDPRTLILCRTTANGDLARHILGVRAEATAKECRAAYLKKTKEAHPDRGGLPGEWELISAAWSYLKGLSPP